MEILLQDLLPGQEYLLQLRSKNQQGVSQWSRAYAITTDSDVISPSPITGLSWVVSRAAFIAEWTAPTTDSDGEELKDFKDFKVSLTADSQTVVFYATEERFDFNIERNIASFGDPQATVEVKIEVRDTIGNLSTPVISSASNSIPADVTGFDATSALGGINFIWNHVSDDDLKTYEIYGSSSPAFTPSPGNLRATTSENQLFYATSDSSVQYFKIRAVDLFDQGSANYTLESGQAYPIDGIPDEIAPSQPSAPTISLGTLVAQVSHDMTKQGGGSLESDVDYLEVHASVTTGFTPSSATLRGTIDSAGLGIPVSSAFFFPSTDSMTDLYWKIIAVDRSKNKSIASNETTGLPGLIENINILNATITDAKIQNLSAAKLIAGTAIINDLFVQAGLTVSGTGFVESDNYVAGTSGWKINASGDAEFNDVAIRGDLISGTADTYISIYSDTLPEQAELEVVSTSGIARVRTTAGNPPFVQLEKFNSPSASDFFTMSVLTGLSELSYSPGDGFTANDVGIRFFDDNEGMIFYGGGNTTRRALRWESTTGYLKSALYNSVAHTLTTETWTDAMLQNGWTNAGGGFANVGYRIMPDGTVLLRGAANPGTLADGTVLFTLPSGYRPSTIVILPIQAVGGPAQSRIRIQTSGVVDLFSLTGATVIRLDGARLPLI